MRLCSCGFANQDGASTCIACGAPLGADATPSRCPSTPSPTGGAASAPLLILTNVRTGEVIRIVPPGGILGRAGDFAPDSFSPRVSGVHAVMAVADGHWTIEHTGRNGSSVERGGTWTALCAGIPFPLFGGETLKLADMLFRVAVEEREAEEDNATPEKSTGVAPEIDGADPTACPAAPDEAAVETAPEAPTWSVRCPVCGTEHPVEGPEARVDACSFCRDALDARQIARVAPRPVHHPLAP